MAMDKAAEIEAWIDQVAHTWNVLPVDGRTFRALGEAYASTLG